MIRRFYSGDGSEGKRSVMVWDDQTGTWTASSSTYLIRSTVLGGQLVTEVNNTGKKLQTYVIAAGAVIARQKVNTPDTSPTESVSWEHRDPGDTEVKYTNSSGGTSLDFISDHYDTIGRMVGSPSFTSPTTPPHSIPSPFEEIPDELGGGGCQVEVDGLLQKCDTVNSDNTILRNRHGDKVGRSREVMPGSGIFLFEVTFTFGDTRTSEPVVLGDHQSEDWAGEIPKAPITVGFTVSWNFAHSNGSCPWCHDGAGHTNEHAQGGSGISQECKSALAAINKNETILNRALQNRSWFVFQGQHFDPQVLAAIAIRESEVDPNRVEAGGNGRGLMQIDIGQHPEYANDPQLFDPNWSVKTADSIMAGEFANLEERYGYQGYSLMLMGLHVHNGGYFKTRDRRGKPIVDQAKMRQLSTSQNPKDFDSGTTGNNYVTSILNIAKNCFPTQWN